ncbi:MAG: Fur family transcriptional regulator [Thermaurantiacus sp.]
MASHAHIDNRTPEALGSAAAQTLTKRGGAWTELRSQVFEVLAAADQPVSAYDVADRLSSGLGRRVAANSVYRILDLFVEHDLAKRVESRNAYVANVHPECTHDCIFLVCEDCGRISHLDDDAIATTMRSRAGATGFEPRRQVLEVLGRCGACATA